MCEKCESQLTYGYGVELYDDSNDECEEFYDSINNLYHSVVKGGSKVFTTDVDIRELYNAYISNLPKIAQQNYTCNACKDFIYRFGGLVSINENGEKQSAIWDLDYVPKFFYNSIQAMTNLVKNANVNGVFISDEKFLGKPYTGDYSHMYIRQPKEAVNPHPLKTDSQRMAELKQDYQMLSRALAKFPIETVETALRLIKSETMYRSDRVLGVAEFFMGVHKSIQDVRLSTDKKKNLVWLAVANAPVGFCHINSSMIGTLLEDILSGMSLQYVASRFAEKMNPSNYMRSQSAPSSNTIVQAERVVEKLGIADSLERRYASFDEIQEFLWKDNSKMKIQSNKMKSSGVFGHIQAKDSKKTQNPTHNMPISIMTWEKFVRTVLPMADSIEALVDDTNRLMALVTSANPKSKNILQWDNPFSWYYHGGVDSEIKKRVQNAGGRYENNDIRVSLIWDGYTDLDLHCTATPDLRSYERGIYFGNRRVGRGWLDVDANGGSAQTQEPVENIRWDKANDGLYRFKVHNFKERGYGTTPFKVELEVNGKIYVHQGVAQGTDWEEYVFEFYFTKGGEPEFRSNGHYSSTDDSWGVQQGSFVKVNGITTSPNLWGNSNMAHSGTHVFFMLDGVKDMSEGKGRGFFNEMLTSDLREVRKTLEAYTASTPIQGAEQASACGVGYSKDKEWGLTLKVKSGNITQLINIDRWD